MWADVKSARLSLSDGQGCVPGSRQWIFIHLGIFLYLAILSTAMDMVCSLMPG